MSTRFWRRFLRLTAGAFTALVVVGLAVLLFADLSRHRAAIEARASALLGREVRIDGDIQLDPAWPPALELEAVRVASPAWASAPELARIGRARLVLDTAALLDATLAVATVTLEDFELSLEHDGGGRWSWSDGGRGGPPGVERWHLRDGTVRVRESGSGREWALALERLEAALPSEEPAALRAEARLAGHRIEVEASGGHGAALFASHVPATRAPPWPLEARLALEDALELTVNGALLSAPGAPRFEGALEARGGRLTRLGEILGFALPPFGSYALTGELAASGRSLRLGAFALRLGERRLEGELTADWLGRRPRVSGRLTGEALAWPVTEGRPVAPSPRTLSRLSSAPLRALDADLALELERLVLAGADVGPLSAALRLEGGVLRVDGLRAAAFGAALEAGLRLDASADPPSLDAEIELEGGDSEAIAAALGARSPVSGRVARARLAVRARGRTANALLGALTGRLVVEDAELEWTKPLTSAPLVVERLELEALDGRVTSIAAEGRHGERPLTVRASGAAPLGPGALEEPFPLTVRLGLAGAELALEGTVASLASTPSVRLEARLEAPDVAALGATRRASAELPVQIEGTLSGTPQLLRLGSLEGRIGESVLTGELTLRRTAGESLWSGRLEAGRVPVEDLRAVIGGLAPSADAASPPEAWLTRHRLDVELAADEVIGLPVTVQALAATVRTEGTRARIAPVRATVEGAAVSGRAMVDLATRPATLEARLGGADLELGALVGRLGGPPLAARLARFEVFLSGPPGGRGRGRLSAEGGQLRYRQGAKTVELGLRELELATGPDEGTRLRVAGDNAGEPFTLRGSASPLAALLAGAPVSVDLELGTDALSAHLRASRPPEDENAGVAFDLELSGDGLRALERWLALAPPALEGPYRLRASGDFSEGVARADALALELAGLEAEGAARLTAGARPRLVAELESPAIDLAGTPEAATREPAQRESRARGRVIPRLPLAKRLPSGLDAQLTWHIAELRLPGNTLRDLTVAVTLDAARLEASATGARSPHGSLQTSLAVDRTASRPRARLSLDARSTDVGPLLRRQGESPRWPVDLALELEGPGMSLAELLAEGDGRLELVAGRMEGESAQFRRLSLNLLELMLPRLAEPPRERLECAVARLEMADGIAKTDGVVAETESLAIAVGGFVDLGSEALGLVLTPKPKSRTLLGVATPVQVSGTLAEPEFSVAPADAAIATGRLLLGLANPYALIGSYVFSSTGDKNPCAGALAEARTRLGEAAEREAEPARGPVEGVGKAMGGLFDFLLGRDAGAGEAQER